MYVTDTTFHTLVRDAFGVDWPAFMAQFDRDNVYGAQVVDEVYVNVPDLGDVKAVAAAVTEAGYASNFTLRAFDDLAGSLDSSALLGLVTVLAALVGCLVYILLSIRSYLSVSHKDMAILRHAGFSPQAVSRMYGFRLSRIFLLVAAVAGGYQLLPTGLLLRGDALRFATLNLLLSTLLLAGLHVIVSRVLVPRHSRLDVLVLLRADKEFE